jgi:hypothetical protein
MKRIVLVLSMVAMLMAMSVAPAFAARGGMPAAHGLSGAEWGAAVSALAHTASGAVAAHIASVH